ncbi:MAG: ABC transporter substrate-binding protein, partial [Pirellulales bacterium]
MQRTRKPTFCRLRPQFSAGVLTAMLAVAVLCSGCGDDADQAMTPEAALSSGGSSPNATVEERLLEPFDPPPLEQLLDSSTWLDRPVRDAVESLREEQAGEPILATPAEALGLANDADENNAKILSALGRQPEQGEADLSASVNRHIPADVGSTNPILISSTAEFDVLGLTGFGIFSFDRRMEPFASADAVVSWQTSADGLLDKVVLRDDLVWSDGQPITAHDVAFTFQVIMDPRVPVPAVRSGTDQLRWVHAYDDTTLVFFHKEPFATNVWNINFPVLPKHVYEATWEDDPTLKDSSAHVKLEQQPVSGGPYEIVERTRGQQIVLRRRESWHTVNGKQVRQVPYFEEIRFRIIEDPNTSLLALKAGEIEEMMLAPEQWTT